MSALDFLPDTPASKRTPGYLFWTRLVPESESLLLRAGLSLSPQPQRDSSWVAIVLGCWLHHSLALWILENYFMYLCLSFLICKRRMMLPLLRADFEVKPGYHMKSAWHIIISHYYYFFLFFQVAESKPRDSSPSLSPFFYKVWWLEHCIRPHGAILGLPTA